jgi:hypothetical protein
MVDKKIKEWVELNKLKIDTEKKDKKNKKKTTKDN